MLGWGMLGNSTPVAADLASGSLAAASDDDAQPMVVSALVAGSVSSAQIADPSHLIGQNHLYYYFGPGSLYHLSRRRAPPPALECPGECSATAQVVQSSLVDGLLFSTQDESILFRLR